MEEVLFGQRPERGEEMNPVDACHRGSRQRAGQEAARCVLQTPEWEERGERGHRLGGERQGGRGEGEVSKQSRYLLLWFSQSVCTDS